MIKAVFFDLDGTLLDTTEGVLESVTYAAKQMNYEIFPSAIMRKFVGPPIQNSFMKYYGCDVETAQKAANIFRDYYKNNALLKAIPYKGIYETLDILKSHNIKMAVATYKREDYALTILKHFGFDTYCSSIHGADNFNKLTKTDIINVCIDELQEDKENIVLVGDTEHDAIGAEKAGIQFIGVTYGFGFKEDIDVNIFPNIGVINNMTELTKYI